MFKVLIAVLLASISIISCDTSRKRTIEVHIDSLLPTKAQADSEKQRILTQRRPPKPPKPPKPIDTIVTPPPPPSPVDSTTSSEYTILYDFDGHTVTSPYWTATGSLVCAPAAMSSGDIELVMERIRTDFSRFYINITTNEAFYLSKPANKRIRVVITPTSSWRQGVSGIAYVGSIDWGDETPAFVFSDRLFNTPTYVGAIAVHESGHTLGLTHQTEWNTTVSPCILVASYKMGCIMGNNLYDPSSTWIHGTTYSCTTFQNDPDVLGRKLGKKW